MCKVTVQFPSGIKVDHNYITLSEFGEYVVEIKCPGGCKQYYSFNVIPFQPTDTVVLTICGNAHALSAIESGLSGSLSTRSLDEKSVTCGDYKKDTVYAFEYISGCLDEVDRDMDIFPNPSSETVHMVNKQNVDKKYMVINSNGVVVKTGELPSGLMVTFGGLDAGVYRVLIYSDSGSYSIYKQIISK